MPWHSNSISVGEVQPEAAAAAAAPVDVPVEKPGVSLDVRLSKEEAAKSLPPAEVSRERPVAIVYAMKRSPRMERFGEGPTLAPVEEDDGPTPEISEPKQNATEEFPKTKIVLESEKTSNPKQNGESRISGWVLPQQPCVCGSDCCQTVEEVMTLPIILQWKGECSPSAPSHVKSEVFSEGTMKTFSSNSVDSTDVVLRETLV